MHKHATSAGFRLPDTDPTGVKYEQVARHVRGLIKDGTFKPLDKLPTMRELAALWKVHPLTIHTAMKSLEKEGWVVRRHGKGTFVRIREVRLDRVGIYLENDLLVSPAYFQRAIFAHLISRLKLMNTAITLIVDPRPAEKQGTVPDTLRQALKQHELQVLFAMNCDRHHRRWMPHLPIPAVWIGDENKAGVVRFEIRQKAELCIQHLAKLGCRSFGLLSPYRRDCQRMQGGVRHPHWVYYDTYRRLAHKYGLKCKESWLCGPTFDRWLGGIDQARFAYQSFHRLWNLSERPEGLIVEPDSMVPGFLLALLERQVKVPDLLRLILDKNYTNDYFCPVPATFAVVKESEVAAAMIAQAQGLIDGSAKGATDIRTDLVSNTEKQKPAKHLLETTP